MQIILDQNEKLQVVYLCLTTGLPYFPDYGLTLDYDSSEYALSRDNLRTNPEWKDKTICIEDVQIEMLRMGFDLIFIDEESDDDNLTHLNRELIEKNWDKIPVQKVLDMALENGNWDSETADIVMQYILFGEVVYG